ncbi:MAG: GumC family protein [Pirellulaceae bacterium]
MTQQHPTSTPQREPDYLRSLIDTAGQRPGLWIVPLMAAVLIGLLIGFVGPKQWDATQSFVVREELIGRIVGPGRFESLDTMKTAQQTIQEVARRPVVLRRVLQIVGPTRGEARPEWPSRETIESMQGSISFFAPGGSELGKTEVLSMRVKSSSAARAEELVSVLFDELKSEIRTVRQRRAESMMREVEESLNLAYENHARAAVQLQRMETRVGADLGELRRLNDPLSSGNSGLQSSLDQVNSEMRSARSSHTVIASLIEHLESAAIDPGQLVATPRELLDSQPALLQMKNKLFDAQVNASNLGGRYSDRHPLYQAALNAVEDIRAQINQEIPNVVRSLTSQQQLTEQRVRMLTNKQAEIRGRMNELVDARVEYRQLVSELHQREQQLLDSRKEYSQAESIYRAASNVDFLSKMDEAQAGIRPLGPSRKSMLLGAAIAGLLIGLGLVMMVTPTPNLFPPSSNGGSAPVATPPAPDTPPNPKPDASSGTSVTTVPGNPGPGFVIPDISSTGSYTDQTR